MLDFTGLGSKLQTLNPFQDVIFFEVTTKNIGPLAFFSDTGNGFLHFTTDIIGVDLSFTDVD